MIYLNSRWSSFFSAYCVLNVCYNKSVLWIRSIFFRIRIRGSGFYTKLNTLWDLKSKIKNYFDETIRIRIRNTVINTLYKYLLNRLYFLLSVKEYRIYKNKNKEYHPRTSPTFPQIDGGQEYIPYNNEVLCVICTLTLSTRRKSCLGMIHRWTYFRKTTRRSNRIKMYLLYRIRGKLARFQNNFIYFNFTKYSWCPEPAIYTPSSIIV